MLNISKTKDGIFLISLKVENTIEEKLLADIQKANSDLILAKKEEEYAKVPFAEEYQTILEDLMN